MPRKKLPPMKCAVPGCENDIYAYSTTKVCRSHNHRRPYCQCIQCTRESPTYVKAVLSAIDRKLPPSSKTSNCPCPICGGEVWLFYKSNLAGCIGCTMRVGIQVWLSYAKKHSPEEPGAGESLITLPGNGEN